MHTSVLAWTQAVINSEMVEGKRILEVGSLDVNGSVRPYLTNLAPASYLGVDMRDGPGVDMMAFGSELPGHFAPGSFDLVITTEMFEHCREWQETWLAMLRLTATGGYIAVTTRSVGFGYHGYPDDWWRFSVDAFRDIAGDSCMDVVSLLEDPECPGVFFLGRTTQDPTSPVDLSRVTGVTPMVQPTVELVEAPSGAAEGGSGTDELSVVVE